MSVPSYGDTAPIAAQATTLSPQSALALIRTSGKGALETLAPAFSRPQKLLSAPGNSIVYGWITGPGGEKIDEVLVSIYHAPGSYTGEEGADISCHGGIAAAKAVMEALRFAGFRDALPGEFTFRAFMNGKLDLTRAESVMELVSAKTGRARERAVGRLSGALEREISHVKDLLVRVLAGAELFLDYSEDEADTGGGDETAGRLPDRPLAEAALELLRGIAASYCMERLYREGALVVIAGRPNAGKSSLFNYLLKEERSIVTDIPGTTRDWIEAWISVEGIPVRLADTAGLHRSQDPVERLGIERSRELLAEADLILYVIDGTEGMVPEDRDFFRRSLDGTYPDIPAGTPVIPLWNKADLTPPSALTAQPETEPPHRVSASTGMGIPELIRTLAARLEQTGGPTAGDSAGIGTARQKELIDRAIRALEEALALAEQEEPLDLIAPLLREGVNALGEITGEVSAADILDAMFSRFCVGK